MVALSLVIASGLGIFQVSCRVICFQWIFLPSHIPGVGEAISNIWQTFQGGNVLYSKTLSWLQLIDVHVGLPLQHALSLPFFALLLSDIGDNATVFSNSGSSIILRILAALSLLHVCCIFSIEPIVLGAVLPTIPNLWLYLLANVMTQYPLLPYGSTRAIQWS